jgi:hypothetical protein
MYFVVFVLIFNSKMTCVYFPPSFESLLNSIGTEKIYFSVYHFTGLLIHVYYLHLWIFADIIQAIELSQRSWRGYPEDTDRQRYDRCSVLAVLFLSS